MPLGYCGERGACAPRLALPWNISGVRRGGHVNRRHLPVSCSHLCCNQNDRDEGDPDQAEPQIYCERGTLSTRHGGLLNPSGLKKDAPRIGQNCGDPPIDDKSRTRTNQFDDLSRTSQGTARGRTTSRFRPATTCVAICTRLYPIPSIIG